MSRFGFFLAGLIVGAWCAGLAMRWEQVRGGAAEDRSWRDAWRDLERADSA